MPLDIANLPSDCGVYIMKNDKGQVLYIGKAINLKKRVQQYFTLHDTRPLVEFLLKEIAHIETIVVFNEKEALLLENNLIKKHQPKYNILLKDDKTYVSLVLTHHKWPALKLMRCKSKTHDKNIHFGPYTNAKAARSVLDLLLKLYPIRQCSDAELTLRQRPCILYDMSKCIAPCVNKCTHEEYDQKIKEIIKFLKGDTTKIIENLKKQMEEASDHLEFEKAQDILTLIHDIEKISETQYVEKASNKDLDVFGLYREGTSLIIAKLIFHHGKLIGSEHFSFSLILSTDEEILEAFLLQHYKLENPPSQIYLPLELKSQKNIEEIIFESFHKKTDLFSPKIKEKKQLINLANQNAKSQFKQEQSEKSLREKQLLELQETLQLSAFPKNIVCFDTSNIAGSDSVAAMVGFSDGLRDKKQTKLFKIRSLAGGDIAFFKEVLFRHFSKIQDNLPDLLILDGGKAHLNIALSVFDELKIATVDVMAIAKEEARHDRGLTKEKIYLPHKKEPLLIDPKSPLLFLLQKIRDEAHRVAISFHKKRRLKRVIASSLDAIKGIEPQKKKLLLTHFKSVENLKKSSYQELKKIKALSEKDIKSILDFINQ
ncbi:MAG: excinuclease ABC subunit UvrC [Chlamydiae bacterium]|nr:excinuclease ABC subunit UvrC [Chlamydiota bacterium]